MKVLLEKKDSICWIIFNRPEKLNALDRESWDLLSQNLRLCNNDPGILAIVLTGNGRAFSAGDDIYAMYELKNPKDAEDFFLTLYNAVESLIDSKKPVICAVNGLAYGGGCEILLFCDIVISSDDAKFSIPEGKLGLIPPMAISVGTKILGRKISRLALTGDSIDANEAKNLGLVDIITTKDKLIEEVYNQVKMISSLDENSILVMKKWLRSEKERVKKAIMELQFLSLNKEAKKRMRDFINKRK
ncbi:enoyl-CoA hydratase/isomerase family protein [Acidianus sulfidivorans JP7]|uniref:Enoyl-CoA hydratase n=1 Tax=Acidianus sulfidivorans JP7 TaxID=619593 RepID=A0A2U9IJH5_9CREN|nr:enoyl-CoA hydratase/isomerase family protein [Acidianus sulfidivorans]AWR96170.1 enoyl-CoA hydratase/isomerase family protein [Acidianus sulfidivorans JP7]